MPLQYRSLRRYRHTIRLVFGTILLCFSFFCFFGYPFSTLIPLNSSQTMSVPNHISKSITWTPTREQVDWRISKATISYKSSEKTDNARTIALHDLPNEYSNYKTHTLHTPIVRGALNKFIYLQSLITTELQQPIEHQVEWILYVNSAVMLANPHIPLHHFLPPITDVETFKTLCIIAAKSQSDDLNTSVFFIRVSAGSLRILTEAMETIYNAPSYTERYRDENNNNNNGVSLPSAALQEVLYRENHRDEVIFQPQEWYNSTISLFYQSYFPTPAHRLVWLSEQSVSAPEEKRNEMFPDEETVHRFWHVVREARGIIDEAREKGHTSEQGACSDMVKRVKEWVELRAGDTVEVERRIAVLRDGLQAEEIDSRNS